MTEDLEGKQRHSSGIQASLPKHPLFCMVRHEVPRLGLGARPSIIFWAFGNNNNGLRLSRSNGAGCHVSKMAVVLVTR